MQTAVPSWLSMLCFQESLERALRASSKVHLPHACPIRCCGCAMRSARELRDADDEAASPPRKSGCGHCIAKKRVASSACMRDRVQRPMAATAWGTFQQHREPEPCLENTLCGLLAMSANAVGDAEACRRCRGPRVWLECLVWSE